MKTVDYKDKLGRQFRVLLPDGVDEAEVELGIPVGPPPIEEVLNLPEDVLVRLHNQLFTRNIWTYKDASAHPKDILAALQQALNVDAIKIVEAYKKYEDKAIQWMEETNGRSS